MNFNRFLIKLDRFSGWTLLVLIILFIISGYGMTKQTINPVTATFLHDKLLPIPLFIFFILHVGISTRVALRRWKVFKNEKTGDVYILIIGLVLFIFFLWLFFA